MKPTSEELLARIDAYVERLFAPLDAVLERNIAASTQAGLPAINVSAAQGKLIYLLTRMSAARRVLEIGTLGGFSTTWLARALPIGGQIVTLELNPAHAKVAQANLEDAAPGVSVDVRIGDAIQSLEQMIANGEPPFDLVFIDADKPRYADYLELALRLSRPGTVILADNVLRHGLVMDENPDDENARAARAYNAAIAAHPRLESVVVPILRETVDGLAISIVR